jgi:predicted ferric reductase
MAAGPLRSSTSASAASLRGPLLLVVACLVPLFLWGVALPLEDRFADPYSSFTSLGVALALVGVTAFALNLVLGARLSFVDGLFGGLDKMYKVHQINGRVAFLLLVGHACLIFAGRATLSLESALGLLTPSAGWTIGFGVLALSAMAVSIALTLYARLNHEVFVYVQRSFGFVFLVAAAHVFTTPGTKAFSPALTWYIALVSIAGVGAFAYRSLFDDVLVRRYDFQVTRARPLNPAVMEVTMSPRNGPLRYQPGQFVYVTFSSRGMDDKLHPITITSEGPSEVITLRSGAVHNQFHPFSITSAPEEHDLRVVVKAVGDYTRAMRALEQGASARVEGPYGKFSYRHASARRQVWIAGGIGITPFLSMARSLRDPELDIVLFYAVKERADAVFVDELESIARASPGFTLVVVVEEEVGFVTADLVADTTGGLEGKDFLVCGPPVMINALRAQLAAKGVPPGRIHFELFGFVQRQTERARR